MTFQCPTRVHTDLSFGKDLEKCVMATGSLMTSGILLTSPGWLERGIAHRVGQQLSTSVFVGKGIPSHPKLSDIVSVFDKLPIFDCVIAVGGGSVIDGAKVISLLRAIDGDVDYLRDILVGSADLPEVLGCAPIVAIPTTAGSGSEVTRWGTVWGSNNEKYSLSHPELFPHAALLDPSLCVSMSQSNTLSGALDALSHSMEAIWNVNSTLVSDFCAAAAIYAIRRRLPELMARPESIRLRADLQVAAFYAGLAMSTTRTALCHSISYRLTACCGLPHGFASSLTLGEVARFNAVKAAARVKVISDAFGCDLREFPDRLHRWMKMLGVPDYLKGYLTPASAKEFGDDLIDTSRAGNNIREASGEDARDILSRSLAAILV